MRKGDAQALGEERVRLTHNLVPTTLRPPLSIPSLVHQKRKGRDCIARSVIVYLRSRFTVCFPDPGFFYTLDRLSFASKDRLNECVGYPGISSEL